MKKIKLVVIAVLSIILLAAAVFYGQKSWPKSVEAAPNPQPDQVVDEDKLSYPAPLGQFAVNLMNPGYYAQAGLIAHCSNFEMAGKLKRKEAKIRDIVIAHLTAASWEDLLDPERMLLLKDQISTRLNELGDGGSVVGISFTELKVGTL